MLQLRRQKISTLEKKINKKKNYIDDDPAYTISTIGFYGSLHASSMHKPWSKTMVLCMSQVCMHKTIGLNYGFVHTVLYIYFLQHAQYEKKIYKFKVLSSCFSGNSIVSYHGGRRFKPCLHPLYALKYFQALVLFSLCVLISTILIQFLFSMCQCTCVTIILSHCTFLILSIPYNFHTIAKNLQDSVLAGDVDLQHISTNLQTVDIFTKALGADNLWQFMTDLGLMIPDLPSFRGSTEEEITNNSRIPQLRNST